mmetsp:Transcript_101/g.263  ORF Transcript_101/g.263 Transcript_101/m.263 type:complete len:232 (-) Transcript_101:1517-2212(-)
MSVSEFTDGSFCSEDVISDIATTEDNALRTSWNTWADTSACAFAKAPFFSSSRRLCSAHACCIALTSASVASWRVWVVELCFCSATSIRREIVSRSLALSSTHLARSASTIPWCFSLSLRASARYAFRSALCSAACIFSIFLSFCLISLLSSFTKICPIGERFSDVLTSVVFAVDALCTEAVSLPPPCHWFSVAPLFESTPVRSSSKLLLLLLLLWFCFLAASSSSSSSSS